MAEASLSDEELATLTRELDVPWDESSPPVRRIAAASLAPVALAVS